MCENDAAVDAWFEALRKEMDPGLTGDTFFTKAREVGHMRGVIRELAATVPGVREWLMENMP